ncbi:MAG: glycosyltransferase family 9 protein [Chitinispirillia bacterium]
MLPLSFQLLVKKRITLLYDTAGYGDTLLVAAVARELKKKYGKIEITVNRTRKELLDNNPNVDNIGQQYNGVDLNYHYGKYNIKKNTGSTLIQIMCKKVSIENPENLVDIYFTKDEIKYADMHTSRIKKPVITIHTTSNNFDNSRKFWPVTYWERIVDILRNNYTLIQLGNSDEIPIRGSINFLGKQNIRLSIALIKKAKLHLGIVSSLMHGAAAVGTPAIILFGGFERFALHQYKNIFPVESYVECSPCIKANEKMEKCPYKNRCMSEITPEMVIDKMNLLGYNIVERKVL